MTIDTQTLFIERPHLDNDIIGEADTMPESMCFIAGCHRSGTTILHKLLASSPDVSYVSAYDIYYYPLSMTLRKQGLENDARQFLEEKLNQLGETRQLDSIPIGPDEPEEFGFILPEQHFLHPRLVPDSQPHFEELCRKMRWLDPKPTLILKNPNEFYGNLLAVAGMYPEARFVVVHRHPLMILHSQVRAWRQMVDDCNPYFAIMDPVFSKLIGDPQRRIKTQMVLHSEKGAYWIQDLLVRGFESYHEFTETVDAVRILEVRYEDLCREPSTHMASIQEWMGIEPVSLKPDDELSPRKNNPADIAKRVHEEHLSVLRPYMETLGYSDWPEDI